MLRSTLAVALFVASFAAARAAHASGVASTIDVGSTETAALVVLTPNGPIENVDRAPIAKAAASVLKRETRLGLTSLERVGASPRRFASCAREDLRCRVRACTEGLRGRRPRFLMAISVVLADQGDDRLSIEWIDLDRASETMRRGTRDPDDADLRRSMRTAERTAQISDAAALERTFESLIEGELRDSLDSARVLGTAGSIEISDAPPLATVELDGKTVGTIGEGGGATLLVNVPPGRPSLTIALPGMEPRSQLVDVTPGRTTRVEMKLAPLERPLTTPEPDGSTAVVRWSGLVLSTLGVATIGAAAIVAPSGAVYLVCLPGECQGGRGFLVTGEIDRPRGLVDRDPGGVPLAPVGVAAIVAGATWALGPSWLDDEDAPPWRSLVAGLILGTASYAIAANL